MAWDNKDTALAIQGVGSLASAWGQYESDKKRNKLLQQQLDYEQKQNDLANQKQVQAQASLDNAFDTADLNLNKKKKKKNPLDAAIDTNLPTA